MLAFHVASQARKSLKPSPALNQRREAPHIPHHLSALVPLPSHSAPCCCCCAFLPCPLPPPPSLAHALVCRAWLPLACQSLVSTCLPAGAGLPLRAVLRLLRQCAELRSLTIPPGSVVWRRKGGKRCKDGAASGAGGVNRGKGRGAGEGRGERGGGWAERKSEWRRVGEAGEVDSDAVALVGAGEVFYTEAPAAGGADKAVAAVAGREAGSGTGGREGGHWRIGGEFGGNTSGNDGVRWGGEQAWGEHGHGAHGGPGGHGEESGEWLAPLLLRSPLPHLPPPSSLLLVLSHPALLPPPCIRT
ncbi:unnamed protein product [Closterium sp. NIES-64]|nr:unnamed protein product [Closterium sp. NIES-64]